MQDIKITTEYIQNVIDNREKLLQESAAGVAYTIISHVSIIYAHLLKFITLPDKQEYNYVNWMQSIINSYKSILKIKTTYSCQLAD